MEAESDNACNVEAFKGLNVNSLDELDVILEDLIISTGCEDPPTAITKSPTASPTDPLVEVSTKSPTASPTDPLETLGEDDDDDIVYVPACPDDMKLFKM